LNIRALQAPAHCCAKPFQPCLSVTPAGSVMVVDISAITGVG
jgi:hypothetical protein